MLCRRELVLSLFLSLLSVSRVAADEKPCTTHDNGKYYDLSPLQASKDYEIETHTDRTIILNVCQSIRTEIFGSGDGVEPGDVGGAVRGAHGYFSLGKFNTTLSVVDSRPRITMSEGSMCRSKNDENDAGTVKGSSVIEFVCDASVNGPGSPRLIAELPPGDPELGCAYVLEWKTKYACATSEGGGFMGFLFILAIIFLALLLTYTILGTLYNRFVLQLRGFDQIPQFSIEGMKYHGREALDWIKDMIAALDIGGSRGGSSYGRVPSSATNPVSHQSHVSRFGTTDDLENDDPELNGNGDNFIRPHIGKPRSGSFQRPEINPISHQSQVNAARSLSFTASPPSQASQSPPQAQQSTATTVQGRTNLLAQVREPTQEERDFMLGDDDEDAEELVDVTPPAPGAIQNSTSSSSSQSATTAHTQLSSSAGASPPPQETTTAAAARGRDLGGGENTLL
ncbi:mannose 6-phosphate receptor domain-containing protein [Agrocybe pediades]|nr:mannose 6-phosphate receptor domain-containing protein [Agrocybe pediades]